MSIKNKLQIILITYNRAKHIQKTLEQIFYEGSPVQDYDFLVLDNNSTDNTLEVVREWQQKYPNIKYQKNKYNLGLSGNIARAMEIAEKEYVWIISDDDNYDFSNWTEVEQAINNQEKVICVAKYAIPKGKENDLAHQLLQITFISGLITSTSLYTNTTIKNTLDNIFTLFPHLVPIAQYINDGGNIYVVNNAISNNGMNLDTTDISYIRGYQKEGLCNRTLSMNWITGYSNIIGMLNIDKKQKENIFDTAICHEHICKNFENFYNLMKTYHSQQNFMNFIDVYLNISKKNAKKMIKNFINDSNSNKCDICQFFIKYYPCLILSNIKKLIYNMEKTEYRRTLTILGIKIKTKRKKNSVKNKV